MTISPPLLEVHEPLGAVEVDTHPHLLEALGGQGFAEAALRTVRAIEHEEPASARSHDLAAEGPVGPGDLIPALQAVAGHLAGQPLLDLPVLVHQPAVAFQVAAQQRRLYL